LRLWDGKGGMTYTADDLVEMRRGVEAWVYQRVKPFDHELTASEPEEGRGWGGQREGCEGVEVHLVCRSLTTDSDLKSCRGHKGARRGEENQEPPIL